MITNLAYIAIALILLFIGADGLVKGSSSLALRAGLSSLMVGLTVVAFGTSSPELVVSIKAALSQQGDISIGNVVGSNSFNIGLILGLTALVCPIPVHLQVIKVDAPIALGVAILLPFLMLDNVLGRPEGIILTTGIVAYLWLSIVLGRKENSTEPGQISTPPISKHWGIDLAFLITGLAMLILGSHLLVDNSVALAKTLGVGEAVIGLTIVAVGTSIPELATSVVAAIRKQPDIAIGNIVGSNIFNILSILGISSIVSPLEAPGISTLDYGMMIAFSLLLIPLLYTGRLIHRIEGAILLSLYGIYMFFLWPS